MNFLSTSTYLMNIISNATNFSLIVDKCSLSRNLTLKIGDSIENE